MSDNVTKTYNLPRELAAAVRESAEEEGISESAVVRWALEAFVQLSNPKKTKARKKS